MFKVQDRWHKGTVNIINRAEGREIYDVTKIKSIGGNELPVIKNSPAAKTNAPINIILQNQKNTTARRNHDCVNLL